MKKLFGNLTVFLYTCAIMPNQETQLQIISQCEHFLNNLSENDLRLLNRMVVERLNLYRKAKDLNSLAKFNIADRVFFTHNKKNFFGIIIKLNRRSATVQVYDGKQWTVSPQLLTKAGK